VRIAPNERPCVCASSCECASCSCMCSSCVCGVPGLMQMPRLRLPAYMRDPFASACCSTRLVAVRLHLIAHRVFCQRAPFQTHSPWCTKSRCGPPSQPPNSHPHPARRPPLATPPPARPAPIQRAEKHIAGDPRQAIEIRHSHTRPISPRPRRPPRHRQHIVHRSRPIPLHIQRDIKKTHRPQRRCNSGPASQ